MTYICSLEFMIVPLFILNIIVYFTIQNVYKQVRQEASILD